jgi:hypothetical protein
MRPLFLFALLLPFAAGCGGTPYKTASVSGRVTLDNKPVANLAVLFQPVAEGNANPGPGSTGVTDDDGHYTLTLTDAKKSKGAVVGKHMVRITPNQANTDSSDDRPQKRPKQNLPTPKKITFDFEVPAGGTTSADFALTSR